MYQIPKIDADKLKAILDLKELEDREELPQQSYGFIEPERPGFQMIQFLKIDIEGPKRNDSDIELHNAFRVQTPLETKRKRRSVFQRNKIQTIIMEKQKEFIDAERDQVNKEIDQHEALLTEELFQLVMERNKSEDPIDMQLVEEIKKIPQINFAMKRMNEKKWLNQEIGVTNPEKVGCILKGFDQIYKAKKDVKQGKEAPQIELDIQIGDQTSKSAGSAIRPKKQLLTQDKVAVCIKNFEDAYNSSNFGNTVQAGKAGPKVQFLQNQEIMRRRNVELRKKNQEAFAADLNKAPHKYDEVKTMITKLNKIALVKQETINKDIWNI